MKLLISEKAIAGERISNMLSDSGITQKSIAGARVFEFNWKGEPVRCIPLRGHISDVNFPKEYASWSKVPLTDLIKAPILYARKEYRIIDCIASSAPEADEIIIATDADREGESIGLEALKYAKKTNPKIKVTRAYFSAIIKEDIVESFDKLEEFDYNFAYSADARREIDLLWGAVLTRYLSIASNRLGKSFLSVGRVQTPTLALIVERELERKKFESKDYWEIIANCEKEQKFVAKHKKDKFWDHEEADIILAKNISELEVKKVTKKEKVVKRPEPFNTTEFLRAASNLGVTASKAMSLAESLYQKGFTSYPRTDNKAYPKKLDLLAILKKLKGVVEIAKDVDKVLAQGKIVPSKGKETKDHPPIYPVMPVKKTMVSADEWKVYELICRRFLATLYIDAKTGNVSVLMQGKDEDFVATGQVILEPGWKSIYTYSKLKETLLPKLEVNDVVKVIKMDLLAKATQPPAHYSQSSLIKLMETNNLGTKSTRPNIIQKLYFRNYITGTKSIVASEVAFSVIESLKKSCELVTKPEMTANLEKEMDEIAAGKKTQSGVVSDSSNRLLDILKKLQENKEHIAKGVGNSFAVKVKVVGICDKCGGNLIARKGKTNKRFAGCSNYPKCTNTYALPQKGTITSTTKKCEKCPAPVVKVKSKTFTYEMCLNMNCETKSSWKKQSSKTTKK